MIQLGEEIFLTIQAGNILYSDDGFVILRATADYNETTFPMAVTDAPESFAVKGRFEAPQYIGQELEVAGEWRYDGKRKEYSFNAYFVIAVIPKTRESSITFLRSIRGVGEKTAIAVMNTYSDLEVAAMDADILAGSVRGMTISKAVAIKTAINNLSVSSELTKMLQALVPSKTIQKIVAKYANRSVQLLNENPYKMVTDRVLSFKEADAVSKALGLSLDMPERISAGIISSIRELKFSTTSIIVDKEVFTKKVMQNLNVNESLIQEVYKKMVQDEQIVPTKKYLYIKDDFDTECQLATAIADYVIDTVGTADQKSYERKFEDWKKINEKIQLAERQEDAVRAVAGNRLTVVTGGPGTGKTTVLKSIMETYRETFKDSNITLMAPTGLAAKRMSESCGQTALTVHKRLGLTPCDNDSGFDDTEMCSIDGGLIIIDEVSMVGIHLMAFVFDSIINKEDTRIVLVGDIDQLPSVSAGSVLDDLILSEKVKVTRLNRNFRQEAGSAIVDAAFAVNTGDTNLVYGGNFLNMPVNNKDVDLETNVILEKVKKAFLRSVEVFGLEQTYVLSPQRKSDIQNGKITTKTLLSTSALNPIIRDLVNPEDISKRFYKTGSRIFREGDRVINLKNTEKLINGDIGVIKSIRKEDNVTVLIIDFYGTDVEFQTDELKHLDLAYAITVHKSQGCEFDSVIIPSSITQGVLLQRNLLYTAITRGKKQVLIIGSDDSVKKSVTTLVGKTKRDLLAARISKTVDDRLKVA